MLWPQYTSYNEKISSIFVGAGRIKPSAVDKEVYDEDATPTVRLYCCGARVLADLAQHTPLTSELSRLNLLDLTVPFQHLQRTLRPLITSLPVTLLNLQPISTVFFDFYAGLKDGQDHLNSGLDSALYLDQALYETCLGETLPHLPETARQLLRVGALRALEPKLVERTYSTLSAILRTIAPTLLRTDAAIGLTWVEVQPYLQPKRNKSYIRNCVSDAWAGVVRKARAEGLNRLVDGMLEDHEARGMEAVWAKSLKGTNGKLTSRALPIFEILLDRLRQKPTDHNVSTISRVATALVHHCSSSTVMPIFEAVISRLGPLSLLDPGSSTPKLPGSTAMLEVLSTILFVRRGKRFPESLLRPTMLQLAALAPLLSNTDDAKWRRTFVSCVVGSLQAGKLAQWLSPGVNLIDTIWEALVCPFRAWKQNRC